MRTRNWSHALVVRVPALGERFYDLPMAAPDWGTALDEDLEISEGIHQKLTVTGRTREVISWERRVAIFAAHGFACLYCGKVGALVIDHLRPTSRGGTSADSNLAPACTPCNSSKWARTLGSWLKQRTDLNVDEILQRWAAAGRDGELPELT